jgi:hypothetical protein
MIFTPVALVWVIFWWVRTRSLRSFPYLALSAVWAFCLAAFFTLPVIFEQQYAHVETLIIGYFNYLAHFLDIRQIFFNINWGYGASYLGPADTMSFALGYLQWILPFLVLVLTGLLPRLRKYFQEILLFEIILLGSLFLAHSRSTFFWKIFTPLEYLQFPWRFLTLSVFAASFLSGAVALLPKKKFLTALVIFLAVLLNADYFTPREWWPDMTDQGKLSGKSWSLMTTSGIFDYLPKYAPQPPADPPGGDLGIISGVAFYTAVSKKTNLQLYDIYVSSPEALIEIQTYYFPGWKLFLDGKRITKFTLDPLLGRMKLFVPGGNHRLEARFTNTPVRTIGDSLTALGWIGLLVVAVGKMRGWKMPQVWKRKLTSTP